MCALWERYRGDGTGIGDSPEPGWTERLEPYYAKVSSGVYHCPAFEDPALINYYIETRWLRTQGRLDLRTSDIGLSAQFILSGDVSNVMCYPPPAGFNVKYETDDCDKDSAGLKNLVFFGEPYGRNIHRAGNNVLFGDYHVAPYKKFEPTEMTFHPKEPGVNWYDIGQD